MRFQKLDLNLLYALDVLLDEKSITKASKRLHVSQSATSSILARLREYFGDELLVNVGRNMIPTALALSLHEPIHDLLLKVQSTLEIRPQFAPEECDRHFRIVSSDYTSSILISQVVPRLRREAPKLTLELIQPSPTSYGQALRGEVDVVFTPKEYADENLHSELMLEDTYCCIVCASNEFFGDSLSSQQYLSHGHVITHLPGSLISLEEQYFEATGLKRRIEITASNFNAVPELVIGTDRIATMHTRLARKLATYFPIRLLPLPLAFPKFGVVMQWHPYQEQDPAHQWLRGLLRQAALSEPVVLEVT